MNFKRRLSPPGVDLVPNSAVKPCSCPSWQQKWWLNHWWWWVSQRTYPRPATYPASPLLAVHTGSGRIAASASRMSPNHTLLASLVKACVQINHFACNDCSSWNMNTLWLWINKLLNHWSQASAVNRRSQPHKNNNFICGTRPTPAVRASSSGSLNAGCTSLIQCLLMQVLLQATGKLRILRWTARHDSLQAHLHDASRNCDAQQTRTIHDFLFLAVFSFWLVC